MAINRLRFIGLALFLVLMAPSALALTGYYESFFDTNDHSGAVNCANLAAPEPTAWYTLTGTGGTGPNVNDCGDWQIYKGGMNTYCTESSDAQACSAGPALTFTLAAPTTAHDWSFSAGAAMHRKTSAGGSSFIMQAQPAAGTSGVFLNAAWSDATHFLVSTPCASPNDSVTTTVPNTELDKSSSVTFTFTLSTNTVVVAGFGVSCSYVNAPSNDVQFLKFTGPSTTTGVGDDRSYSTFGGLTWNAGVGTYTLPITPTAPAGLRANVVKNWVGPGSDSSQVSLRWPISSNDPNRNQGNFTYDIWINGVKILSDAVTSQDGEGTRYNLLTFTGTQPEGKAIYFIKPSDRGLFGPNSCSVSVDDAILGDTSSCGDTTAIGGTINGGPIVFTTPTDTAAGLKGFCTGLMGDSDGSLFLCGLILAVVAFLGMAGGFAAITKASGIPSVIAGCVAGFGVMFFNVFAGIWGIVWAISMLVIVAAIITFFVRKLFAGGGGSTDGE